MEPLEIGIATIIYAQAGFVMDASFRPTLSVEINTELFDRLSNISPSKDKDILKQNADMALSGWFTKMNEVELADRNEWEVTSEIIDCERYEDQRVRKCVIKYFFRKLKN